MKKLVALIFALTSSSAMAQGLASQVTGTATPTPQVAASDDAWSLYVNPAGIAFVDAFQLVGGYQGEYAPGGLLGHRLSMGAAMTPIDGLTLGAASSFLALPGQSAPTLVQSAAIAFRADRLIAVGGQVHAVAPLAPGLGLRLLGDVGMQVRPVSFLALGLSLEGLGALHPNDRTAVRAGLSLRPFSKYLTVGTDVRLVAGGADPLSAQSYLGATIVPAASAKLQLGGFAVSVGGTVTDLAVRPTVNPGFTVGAAIEVNTAHLGAMLLGDVNNQLGAGAGAGFRVSAESFDSVFGRSGEWIAFTLTGDAVPVQHADNIVEELLSSSVNPITVLAGLERASRDDAIEGVVINLRGIGIGWGRAHELRQSIERLRLAGKKVVIHLDGGDDTDVYLASAADKVFLSPAGGLSLDGLHVTMTYLASALRRFGVKAIAIAAGEYKSAPRTFTADGPNDEELEVQNAILDVTFGLLVEKIADGRGLSADEVRAIIDMGGLTATEAKDKKIVDGLCYRGDIPTMIETSFEGVGKPRLRHDYLDDTSRKDRWSDPSRIAIIPIVGEITMGRSGGGAFDIFGGGGGAGSDDILDAIEAAKNDSDIEAVVLRIDSPGGDALASDLIWHGVMELRETKPVIASMGDVAASGGYYIAAGAHEIYAEPTTITGSIGVFALLFNAEQLADDVGVSTHEISRGAMPGPSLLRSPTDEESARLQEQIMWMYERFLSAIKEGRGIEDEKLRAVAGGRVWTGVDAKSHGLVDQLGGLDEALARAREKAGIDVDDEIEVTLLVGTDEAIPRISTAVKALAGTSRDRARIDQAMKMLLGENLEATANALEGRPMARMPAQIHVR